MLWFFDREQESLRLETRYDNDRAEFVATVTYPDGSERTERFLTRQNFSEWIGRFEPPFWEQHQAGRRGPVGLPDGWPNTRLK